MVGVCVGEPDVGGDFHQLAEREREREKDAPENFLYFLTVTFLVFPWS